MKTLLQFTMGMVFLFSTNTIIAQGNVGIGTTTPDQSAKLDVESTSQGFLPPRMTFAQRSAIASPVAGLMVWCIDCGVSGEMQVYNGTDWTNFNGNLAQNIFLSIIQEGADIDGESVADYSGFSVSLSANGTRVAIGAPLNDDNGSSAGHVRVYDWDGSSWIQLGVDLDGEAAGDEIGTSVSLSANGTRVAIGAPLNDNGNGVNAGHVRVYDWNGSAWMQVGTDIDGEAAGDKSGFSVSLSDDGTHLAIGAYLNDGNSTSNIGHVRVYKWSGTAWTQVGSDINGEAAGDLSGSSVSLSANGLQVAIGAPRNDVNGANDAGHVRVYSWNGSTWLQLGSDIDGVAQSDLSGTSVSISDDGTKLAIGAYGNDGNGTNSGKAQMFQWDGVDWQQMGTDIYGEAAGDLFGRSVSISTDGMRVVIGAYGNDDNGVDAGNARVYDWNGNTWIQVGVDIDGEAAGDESGFSVSISADGSHIAIGAYKNDGVNGNVSGHVRVYK